MTGKRVRAEDIQLGANVNQLMWLRRVTQREVAEVFGVDQASVSKRLRGKQPFTAGELFALARILDVEVTELIQLGGPSTRGSAVLLDPIAGAMPGQIRTLLPRLDSNQQPCDYPFLLLSGGAGDVAEHVAEVIHLADFRSELVPA